ncbi:CPBP family intramembrane glutamic endopeptidase [Nodosilinea sp. P-1105]|uniref:CPBP family intramembrane glutamic endopeptidase n=1 Tax=Nodosilinea sp. P-1105 TaxID=2546229 RepID=UPI001F0D6545
MVPFLLITFGLAWGIVALFIFFPQQMSGMFGELTGQHPLFFLAVYAPAIAAFIIVLQRGGRRGLQQYFSRLLLWRCSVPWYVFLAIGIPLIFYTASALQGDLLRDPFPFDSGQALITASLLMAIKGPIEEFGWRGFALPLLQCRFTPLGAGLILGVIWGIWHVPAFLLSGLPQGSWSFMPFFAGSVAVSVIMTSLYNASRGSLLLAILFHFQLINPLWPDAQPLDMALFVVAAGLIVWLDRNAMLTKKQAVTEVIP